MDKFQADIFKKRLYIIVGGILLLVLAVVSYYLYDNFRDRKSNQLVVQGQDLINTAKYKEAIPFCEEALNLNFENKKARKCLLVSYDILRLPGAEEAANSFIAKYPGEPLGYVYLSHSYEMQGRFDEAKETAAKTVEMFPNDSTAFARLGHVLDREGHLDLALKNYEKAAELDSSNAYAHQQLGRVYTRLGKYQEAKKEYELAKKLSPDYGFVAYESRLNLGYIAYQFENDVELAVRYFEESIKASPDMATPYINLARHYYRAGRVDEAIELDRKAMALDDQLTRPYLDLAEIYLREGKSVDEAITLLADAESRLKLDHSITVSNRERPANIYYFLAAAYSKKNDADKAFESLARAFRYDRGLLLGEVTETVRVNKDVGRNALTDPLFSELRRDPRFMELVNSSKMALPKIGL